MTVLHVLGGGRWQLPTIRLAKSLGWKVCVSEFNERCLGYELADEYAVVDIKDKEHTLALTKAWKADAIVCDTTDVGVPTMAYVAEALGLRGIGYEVALNFTDKHRMRKRMKAAGLPSPFFARANSAAEAADIIRRFGRPCVVKPCNAQSSRGVAFVQTPEQAAMAYETARKFDAAIMVEERMFGTEVTVEGYCVGGAPVVGAVSDKAHIPDTGIAYRLTYPPDFPPAIIDKIVATNGAVVRALGLENGVTHGEFMVCGEEIYLVEIAARGGGSHVYTDILPMVSGQPVPRRYIEFLAGEKLNLPADVPRLPPHCAAELAFFSFPCGPIDDLPNPEPILALPWVEQFILELDVGKPVPEITDDRSRHGLMLTRGRTREEVMERSNLLYRGVRVKIDGVWRTGYPGPSS